MKRGSLKLVLDLMDSGEFPSDVTAILAPYGMRIQVDDTWRPLGHDQPDEWTVRRFCAEFCRDKFDFPRFDGWWVPDKYRNPQWDILSTCSINAAPGLLLIEAKANDQELDWGGKPLSKNASEQSRKNHRVIAECIAEANTALNQAFPGFSIGRDTHYQLSNRVATAWKLAQCGLPVALLYLGFTGDEGMRTTARSPLMDRDHWQRLMGSYLHKVVPNHFPGHVLSFPSGGSMRLLVESLPIREISPQPET